MPDIYRASLRQMDVPFKIPKKKQPSDSCSLDMQSPLSRLQDSNTHKMQWGSTTLNGRTLHKSSSNGNMLSKDGQRSESVRPIRPSLSGERPDLSPDARTPGRVTRTCSDNLPKGATRGLFTFKMNKQPIKISPLRVNGTPNKVSETTGFRPRCQTPTAGRDFPGNSSWRPKRASDTLLCHDENHSGASESSFKIRRGLDPGQLEACGLFHEDEETEETQGSSPAKETSRSSTPEDLDHVSQTDRKLKPTGSVCGLSENAASKNKNGNVSNEESVSKPSNHGSSLHSGHNVQEARTRHLRSSGERATTSVPVKKDLLISPPEAKSKDPFGSVYSNRLRRKPHGFCATYKRTKPRSTEPIVLSSDDEGADEMNDVSGSLQEQRISEGIRDAQSGNQKSPKAIAGGERSTTKVEVPSIMELDFTRLHYDTVEARANGTVVITDEGISVPLKGVDGEGEVAVSVSCSQLCLYGVWDGGLSRDGSLLPSTEEPAPSLLFLVVSDAQSRLLQKELSVLHTVHTSGQACPFVLLVLTGQLEDLQTALLASLMDVIGLKYGQGTLSNALSWADGLNQLHYHPRGEHLLSLLGQNVKDAGQDTAKENVSGTSGLPTVRRPLRSNSRQQSLARRLIQYPPPPSKGGITVTTEDLECLKDGEFLNDVIIDFYLKYLLLERADKDVAERSHIFSSFFYKQLTRKDTSCPEETGSTAPHRRHQRVRTWTRHVDIFSKDYLFIPVNQEAHWYLVVICFPGLERTQYVQWRDKGPVSRDGSQTAKGSSAGECQRDNSQLPKGKGLKLSDSRSHDLPDCTAHSCTRETVCRRPCILVMDSLKLSYHQRIYTLLREYLQVEWEVRKGCARTFTSESLSGSLCRVPLQDNSSDCGLYLLQYVESFLQNPVVHFDLPLRLEHWFPRNQVRMKRKELRELVLQLYRRQGGGAEQSLK
ncbi:sentrin-specific protease 7b isoform X2 [Rhinichthys klamathensis goyatoka]|uniref:sentrin-specific protease 7b isoform X2 n=1 Tax=Rhinichthys klamathensis goyatoka TaxID=3034132 RepID=UPI0024B4939C|nr:sentrin-specific protease 7b isoform X2 [Rhinichthys klamathensis goyatoka]